MLRPMARLIVKLMILSALLLAMPILGLYVTGKPVAPYLRMPPVTGLVEHAPFSPVAFALLAVAAAIALVIPLLLLFKGLARRDADAPAQRRFPWWGWLGLALTGASWIVAWSDFALFSAIRPFVFPPLWLGYVISINAATHALGGHAPLRQRPGFFLGLFPLSALFWWYFEYLNRFVENWHYVGVAELGGFAYGLHSTLAYSTVLPAVVSTSEWLYTLLRPGPSGPRLHLSVQAQVRVAWIALAGASAALALVGVWPNQLHSLLWIAPLVLLLALQTLAGERTLLAGIGRGDWRALYLPALAALQCGFFWEMWNQYSGAKWLYSIPYVHRYEIFEMPLLGYAGYLPFGIECAAVASLLGGTFSFGRQNDAVASTAKLRNKSASPAPPRPQP